MENIKLFFDIIGYIFTFIFILGIIYTLCCILIGNSPIWYRLGIGLTRRRIAIFSADKYSELKDLFTESGVFKGKITQINPNDIAKAKDETIFLVNWDECTDKIEEIFHARKNHQVPVIIFAKPGSIDRDIMEDIGNRSNTVVVNFKGRLLNDVLTSMITTSYGKK